MRKNYVGVVIFGDALLNELTCQSMTRLNDLINAHVEAVIQSAIHAAVGEIPEPHRLSATCSQMVILGWHMTIKVETEVNHDLDQQVALNLNISASWGRWVSGELLEVTRDDFVKEFNKIYHAPSYVFGSVGSLNEE